MKSVKVKKKLQYSKKQKFLNFWFLFHFWCCHGKIFLNSPKVRFEYFDGLIQIQNFIVSNRWHNFGPPIKVAFDPKGREPRTNTDWSRTEIEKSRTGSEPEILKISDRIRTNRNLKISDQFGLVGPLTPALGKTLWVIEGIIITFLSTRNCNLPPADFQKLDQKTYR